MQSQIGALLVVISLFCFRTQLFLRQYRRQHGKPELFRPSQGGHTETLGTLAPAGEWGVDPQRGGGLAGGLLSCVGLGSGVRGNGADWCGMDWWRARCQNWQWAVHQSKSRTSVLLLVWSSFALILARRGAYIYGGQDAKRVTPAKAH